MIFYILQQKQNNKYLLHYLQVSLNYEVYLHATYHTPYKNHHKNRNMIQNKSNSSQTKLTNAQLQGQGQAYGYGQLMYNILYNIYIYFYKKYIYIYIIQNIKQKFVFLQNEIYGYGIMNYKKIIISISLKVRFLIVQDLQIQFLDSFYNYKFSKIITSYLSLIFIIIRLKKYNKDSPVYFLNQHIQVYGYELYYHKKLFLSISFQVRFLIVQDLSNSFQVQFLIVQDLQIQFLEFFKIIISRRNIKFLIIPNCYNYNQNKKVQQRFLRIFFKLILFGRNN
eukprot:TRINITY_DN919_c0_g1_i12.p2 TRINITY_DN919_c0_g1~~TRINITY_DN919_c0_g1_i12.p2  ORF type:complete len:280 (+),score=-27.33 TRINITY_DN919_c0_g1_i12:1429-2268(+)